MIVKSKLKELVEGQLQAVKSSLIIALRWENTECTGPPIASTRSMPIG